MWMSCNLEHELSPIQAIGTCIATLQDSNSEPDDTLNSIFNYVHPFLHSVVFYICEVKSDAGNYNDLKVRILLILICPSSHSHIDQSSFLCSPSLVIYFLGISGQAATPGLLDYNRSYREGVSLKLLLSLNCSSFM